MGLRDARLDKNLVNAADVEVLLRHLWTEDDFRYGCERYRVQLALMLHIMTGTGSRPGALVESSAYKNTNEGLKYKVYHFPSSNLTHF